MQVQPQIVFQNCEPSEELQAEVARQLERIEKFSPRITSCRVVIRAPETRHRQGDNYKIELTISMPQHKDIAVNRSRDDTPENEHPLVAIRNAFFLAQRQIEDKAREMRGQVKVHVAADQGQIARFLAGEDCGFIETADGREIYFHRNAVVNGAFDKLVLGSEVRFVEEQGEKGPQARTVRLVGKRHPE